MPKGTPNPKPERADEKFCWKCQQAKARSDFWKDKTTPDGLQRACTACQSSRNSEYGVSHKEYFKTRNAKRYREIGRHHNHERYMSNRESFLRRRDKYSSTTRGKLIDLLNAAQFRARKRGIQMDLTIDDLMQIFMTQNGLCAVTGQEMQVKKRGPKDRGFLPWNISIDRKDSNGTYTFKNVRLVCTVVNLALNNFGDAVFEKMCRSYVNINRTGTYSYFPDAKGYENGILIAEEENDDEDEEFTCT
jgi:hypothetical protein